MKQAWGFRYLLYVAIGGFMILGGLTIYNRWRASIFREGYERGALQTAAYVYCTGWKSFPSAAYREKYWRVINLDRTDEHGCLVINAYARFDILEGFGGQK